MYEGSNAFRLVITVSSVDWYMQQMLTRLTVGGDQCAFDCSTMTVHVYAIHQHLLASAISPPIYV